MKTQKVYILDSFKDLLARFRADKNFPGKSTFIHFVSKSLSICKISEKTNNF